MTVEPDRHAVHDAFTRESRRVADLVRCAERLGDPVPGLTWTTSQLVAHLTVIYQAFAAAVRGEDLGNGANEAIEAIRPATANGADATLPQSVAVVNARAVEMFPVAGPAAGADALTAAADDLAAALADHPDSLLPRPTPWYGADVTRTVGTLASLAVSETLVHGRDLALALGRDPRLPSASATAVAATVMSEMLPLLLDERRARGVAAGYELRIRRGQRFALYVAGGRAWTEPAGERAVDCVISLSGPAALLVGFARQPLWRAVLTGRAFAYGRRPWLGPRMPGLFLTP